VSVINRDEWREFQRNLVEHPECYVQSPLIFLCLLDLARYGIRWGAPEPEWVRCVDTDLATGITYGKTYRVVARGRSTLMVVNDYGDDDTFLANRFVPASADEATVTIEVPVAWARARATLGQPERALSLAVDTTCREALTKAGLL
jgi:hypothetical protein